LIATAAALWGGGFIFLVAWGLRSVGIKPRNYAKVRNFFLVVEELMPKKGPLDNLDLPSVDDLDFLPLDDGNLQPLDDLVLPRVGGGGLNPQSVMGFVPVQAIGYKIAKLNRKSPPEFTRLPWGTMMSEI
jgi:hypothetical protein